MEHRKHVSSTALYTPARIESSVARSMLVLALPPLLVSFAAAISAVSRLTGQSGSSTETVVWLALALAIVASAESLASLARATLLPTAVVAAVLPFVIQRLSPVSSAGPVLLLAAITACLALGRAFETWRWARSQNGVNALTGLVWALVGCFALAFGVTGKPGFAAVTILGLGAAVLCQTFDSFRPALFTPRIDVRADMTAAVVGGALISTALIVAALTSGKPFGWPVAGASAAGLISLISVLSSMQRSSTEQAARLRAIAGESRLDALTGLLNRRGFDERLAAEVARANRYGHSLSLLMLDLDDFKRVNDTWGHQQGDHALSDVASIIQRSLRSIDIAARHGGEEFVVILPETAVDGAQIVAERIRSEIERSDRSIPLSVSIGASELSPDEPSASALILRADSALYLAKRSGKNRVELAG